MAPPNSAEHSRPPKRPDNLDSLSIGFQRQCMVSWFDPLQLIQTGIKTLLSSLFGSYSDKRELMPVLSTMSPSFDHRSETDENGDFWFDYIADTGDGFDSTFTVASLLAAKEISLPGLDAPLPRGRLVVLGGDQIYPTASREEYQNRLVGPFRSALPWSLNEAEAPVMYAIPGNHDWYDGLTSFMRLFGQGRWIGGWKTQQGRSYFSLQLPHGWWFWCIDIQLNSDIDHPQILYFESLAREKVKPGERIILCTAEPSWSHQWLGKAGAFRTLGFFEDRIIRRYGHEATLVLSGDIHNYHRYMRSDSQLQRITSGGGGAFLHSTHFLPKGEVSLLEGTSTKAMATEAALATGEMKVLKENEGTEELQKKKIIEVARSEEEKEDVNEDREVSELETTYHFKSAYPSHSVSKNLARGAKWTFFKARPNPGESVFNLAGISRSWGIGIFLALYYLVTAWVIQSASRSDGITLVQKMYHFLDTLPTWKAFLATLRLLWYQVSSSPVVFVYVAILVGGLIAFCAAPGRKKIIIGTLHGSAHFVAFAVMFAGITYVNHWINSRFGHIQLFEFNFFGWHFNFEPFSIPVDFSIRGGVHAIHPKFVVLFSLQMLIAGFFVSGYIFGQYLVLFERYHNQDTFSSQGIEAWKNLLRLRIDSQGKLWVYPIGIESICKRWKPNPSGTVESPWIIPEKGSLASNPKLIEKPICYDPKQGRWLS